MSQPNAPPAYGEYDDPNYKPPQKVVTQPPQQGQTPMGPPPSYYAATTQPPANTQQTAQQQPMYYTQPPAVQQGNPAQQGVPFQQPGLQPGQMVMQTPQGLVVVQPGMAQPGVGQPGMMQPGVVMMAQQGTKFQDLRGASRFQPFMAICPYCNKTGQTRVMYQNGTFTWLIGLGLCCVGCWLCCCIPCCMDDLKDAQHICQHCNRTIGLSSRMS